MAKSRFTPSPVRLIPASCIHGISLYKECRRCKAEIEAEIQESPLWCIRNTAIIKSAEC